MAPIEPEPADESEEDEVDKSPGQRVDYASTMEMAYNNLESVLGKGGIGNLTKETQNLLNQQNNWQDSWNLWHPFFLMPKVCSII